MATTPKDVQIRPKQPEQHIKTTQPEVHIRTPQPSGGDQPRLPHERDESDDSQSSGPRDDMKQAYDDIQRGLMDTDCREQRGVEEVVKQTPAPDRADSKKK